MPQTIFISSILYSCDRSFARRMLMKNIKFIRVTRDITQLKVQMDTGISQSTISKYETGEALPTIENLLLLSDYYNVSLDYLMDKTRIQKRYPPD
jgi:transcriptional regulator with XRE-family HTH domain